MYILLPKTLMIYLLNNLLEKPQLTVYESALFPEAINGLWSDLMNKEGMRYMPI